MTTKEYSKIIIIKGLLVLIMLYLHDIITAQENDRMNISGTVYGFVTGKALGNALISVSGTPVSVTSDEDGKFELTGVEPGAVIVVQLPGYDTRTLFLKGETTLDVKLVDEEYKSLDDLVVLPFGDKKMRYLTQSVDYFGRSDYDKTAATSFDQCIQGKAAGLNVTVHSGMPGSLSTMSIRGPSSIFGRNEPLILLDGVIHETQYPVEGAIDGFVLNSLEIVDIDDIESITVMKDAQSYLGSLASNGVIYINTEERKETSSAIRFHMYQGVISPSNKLSLMNTGQFNNYLNEQIASANLTQEETDARFPWLSVPDPLYAGNTDWQDEIFRSGLLSKYHIFIKGGEKIGTINMSAGYLKHQGIIENTAYSRFNLRINAKINVTKRFSFLPNIKLSKSDSYLMEQGINQVTNPITAANLKPPIMKPYSVDGTDNIKYIADVGAFGISNPVAIVKTLTAQNTNYHLLASGIANFELTKKLSLSTNISINYNNSYDNIFIPDKGLVEIDSAYNTSRVMVTEFRSFQNSSILTYQSDLGKDIKAVYHLGHRVIKSKYEYDESTDLNAPTDDFRSLGMGAEDQFLRTVSGYPYTLNLVSYYALVDFGIKERYFLNGSFSIDGNSTLHKNNRYNPYFSVGGAWRIITGKPGEMVDDMKLRASYGKTGNVYNNCYYYSRLFYVAKRLTDVGILVRESVPNENMEMEKKTTINLGLDISTGGQKFIAGIDLYNQTTNNMIIMQKLAPAFGYSDYYDNQAVLSTNGIELKTDYRFKALSSIWTIGASVSSQISIMTSLNLNAAEGENDFVLTSIEGSENIDANLITKAGEPLYSFYGYETDGVYATDAEASVVTGPKGKQLRAGDVKFVDRDDNNIIDEKDKKILGNPDPLLFGGFFATFSKNRIRVNANFNYSVGNKIYNYLSMLTHSMDNYYNQGADVTSRWTSAGGGSEFPAAAVDDPRGNNSFSDRWIEDGSYLKVKNITISYTLPSKSGFYKNLEIYITGSNLYTFTGYSGYDPEFQYINRMVYAGIDYGKMPIGRSFIAGIKLGL